MTPSRALYLMMLFLASAALCVDAGVTANGTNCSPLREGVYLGEFSFPTELGGTDRLLQSKAVLSLENEGIAYHGTIAGVAFNSQIGELLPRNTQFFLNLWAIFDTKTCTLSGAMYNFEHTVIDAFKLDYDGRVISGHYSLRFNETVPFAVQSFVRFLPTFE